MFNMHLLSTLALPEGREGQGCVDQPGVVVFSHDRAPLHPGPSRHPRGLALLPHPTPRDRLGEGEWTVETGTDRTLRHR